MTVTSNWRPILLEQMPEDWANDIDIFEGQIALRKEGKIDEKVFAETRLRQGAYGQRYDNGQRHDGFESQTLGFPLQRSDQGTGHHLGCAGYAAHQGPLRRPDAGPARSAGHAGRRVRRRHPPRHHPPGHPVSLRPHRRHARPDAAPGRGRHHHARGVRQLGAQHHRLPARRRLQHRVLRRLALRRRPDLVPARPRRHPGLRAQVQDRLLRL